LHVISARDIEDAPDTCFALVAMKKTPLDMTACSGIYYYDLII
jgi:hypothetical protein